MYALRVGSSFIPAMAATLGLLYLMSVLIASDDPLFIEKPNIPIDSFFMGDTTVEVIEEETKPEPLQEVEQTPELLVDTEITPSDDALRITTEGYKHKATIDPYTSQANVDFIPIYVPTPRYPTKAANHGVSGYAVVEVIITETGAVRDPRLLEAWPEDYSFGKEALKAAKKLKYNPRVISGQAVEVPGVLYKFTFALR